MTVAGRRALRLPAPVSGACAVIVADAIAAIGSPYANADGGDLVIVQFRNGRPIHRTLDTASRLSLETDTYLATGAFRAGSITTSGGRSLDNLTAVLSLPFDVDLADWSGFPKPVLHQMPDDDLDALIDDLTAYAGNAFQAVGITPNRVDVTGYGIALHVNVAHGDQRRVAELRDAHRRIGQQINRHAGFGLVDEQALDAGTRIMRLPPSPNTKNTLRPRLARTMHNDEGAMTLDALWTVCAAFPDAPEPVRRIVPNHGRELSPDAEAVIVDAMSDAWSHGQRHAVALGLSGWLAKAGVPQAQTLRIIAALAAGDGDESRDREKAVETTYRNVESGNDAAGYTALRQRMPSGVLRAVDDVLTAYRQATAPTLVLGSGRAVVARPSLSIEPLPEDAFYGVLDEYRDLAAPTTEASDQFHAASFLAMLAAQAGRRFANFYSNKPLYPNLFVLLVGATGSSRKDTAIDRARDLPDLPWSGTTLHVNPWSDLRDVSSGEGLILALKDDPNRLLMLSELTAMMSKSERKGSESLLDYLITAFDCKPLQNNSKTAPLVAEHPYLVVLAATQPERLGNAFTARVVNSGFGNRWLLVPGEGKDAIPEPPPMDRRASAALWRRICENMDRLCANANLPVFVNFDDDCAAIWNAYYTVEHRASKDRNADETIREMRERRPVQVRKIALLLAISDGEPAILPRHLQAAIALVNWSWLETVKLIELWNPSIESRIERRIMDVLSTTGAMKSSSLQRATSNRAWSASDYNRVVKAMLEIGSLVRDADNVIAIGPAS